MNPMGIKISNVTFNKLLSALISTISTSNNKYLESNGKKPYEEYTYTLYIVSMYIFKQYKLIRWHLFGKNIKLYVLQEISRRIW